MGQECDLRFIYFYFGLPWVFVAVCGLFAVVARRGYSPAVHGFLIAGAPLVAEHGLSGARASLVVMHGQGFCIGRWFPSHRTSREVLDSTLLTN